MSYENTDERGELEELTRFVRQHRRRGRDPQPLADVLGRLMARRGYAQVAGAQQLLAVWQQLVGASQAQDSRPLRLQRGVLEVAVRNSSVMQELTFRKRQLLRQLAAAHGGSIRELRFRIAPWDEQ